MNKIKLKEIIQIKSLENVKIRFNLMFRDNWDPIEIFKNGEDKILLEGQYWNYNKKKSYREGQVTIGFIRINKTKNQWLLFHIGKVTKDLNIMNGIGYEYEELSEYKKYFGRLIIKFNNKSQNMIRRAESVIDDCEVYQILPDIFDNDIFPGYDKVNISWSELARVIDKETWRTALQNQKGVYLLTDTSNGSLYVGAAYGDEMILNRWRKYIETYHGNNVELIKLGKNHIKKYFRFSILDIYQSTTDTDVIIARENWWKQVLQSRKFGYNSN